MRTYDKPRFLEPLSSTIAYVGWSVDPVRVGPFVRSSDGRRRKIDEIRGVADDLRGAPEIEAMRLFETSFMPPLQDIPKHDVILLARARTRERAEKLVVDPQLTGTEPTTMFLARNGARFGDTEDSPDGANFLLNHFAGPPDRSAATVAWQEISGWYATKLGMDNSMLLRTDDGAPFVLVNWVRLPATVVGFLLNQLMRPSFHRYVSALLKRHKLTSLPLFVKNVPIGPSGA
jgi:hypothetical protein